MRFEDVDFGEDLPELAPDVSPEAVRRFAQTAGMLHPRFFDAEAARREGLPGAIVPGHHEPGHPRGADPPLGARGAHPASSTPPSARRSWWARSRSAAAS